MKPKILFVDDDEFVLKAFARSLRNKFDIVTCISPKEAIKIIENTQFSVIISDMMMPEIKGSAFLAIAKEKSPNSIRILLTGESSFQDSIDAVNKGQIFRFLTKPCKNEDLVQVIEDSLNHLKLLNVEQNVLEETLKGAISLMVDIVSMVRPDIFSHSLKIRKRAIQIAKHLGYEKMWEIEIGSLLSHLGCVTVERSILLKRFNNKDLTPKEWSDFYSHINTGSKLVSKIPRLHNLSIGISYIEKSYQGDGYPVDDTKGKNIPILGRILNAAHQFEIGFNCYNSTEKVLANLKGKSDVIDPEILSILGQEEPESKLYFQQKLIDIQDLKTGMILDQDLFKGEILLLSKNQTVTDTMRICIRKLWETKQINGLIHILQPRTQL